MTTQSFLANLELLGFNSDKHANGVFNKITFDEHLFSHANNNKAFEATSHFLFAKLDPARTRREFAKCWPMNETEYRRQSREYRSIAYRWLDDLRLSNCLPGQITLRKSYFEDCRGEKVSVVMLGLSIYAMQTEVDRRTAARNKKDENQPIRILGTASVNMLPKEQLINNLKSEINRMSSVMTSNHAMYNSNEPWAKAARSLTDHRDGTQPAPEQKRSSIESRSYNVESLLASLTHRLEQANQKNQELKAAVKQKETQWLNKGRSNDPLPDLLASVRTPATIDLDTVPSAPAALSLDTSTMEDDIQRVKDYVSELVATSIASDNKKRHALVQAQNKSKRTTSTIIQSPELTRLESPFIESSKRILSKSPFHESSKRIHSESPVIESPKRIRSESPVIHSPNPNPHPSPARIPLMDQIQESSPFSYLSEKVSPMSNTFGDYCDQVVNQMVEQFHHQRTPDNIDSRSARQSFASQRSWYRPSPLSQKVAAQDPPVNEVQDNELDSVYQNSPTRRASPAAMRLPRRSLNAKSPAWSSPMSRRLFEQSPAPSPAASSLHGYRAAIEGHDLGLLDEPEPDLFYNSDFTMPT